MTFANFEREEILDADYYSREDYLYKIFEKLDRTLGYNSARIKDTKDLSHTLSSTHDFHAIQIDTKSFDYDFGILSPYITKNVPGSERELRQNLVDLYGLFPYPYQPDNLEMEFQQLVYVQSMCSEYYGDEMMKALGKTSYHKIEGIEDLRNELYRINDTLNKQYGRNSLQVENNYALKLEDVWSFKNYGRLIGFKDVDYFPYDIIRPYKNKHILEHLATHSERGGNCYGMSLTVVLHKMGILSKEEFLLRDQQGNLLRDQDPLSLVSKASAQDLIHLYQKSQILHPLKGYMANENRNIMKLVSEVEKVNAGGPPVLIRYIDSSSLASHAVLAHDIKKVNGEYIISIYDPNIPEKLRETNLKVMPSRIQKWSKAPYWELNTSLPITPDSGKIIYYSTGNDIKDVLDIFINESEGKSAGFYPYLWVPRDQRDLVIAKSDSEKYVIDTQKMTADGLTVVPEAAGPSVPSPSFSVLLPDESSTYRISSRNGKEGPMDFLVNCQDQAIIIGVESVKAVHIDPSSSIDIEKENGRVDIQLLRDQAQGQEDLGYRIQGNLHGDLSLSQTNSGLKQEGQLSDGKVSVPGDDKSIILNEGNISSDLYLSREKQHNLPFIDISSHDWYFYAVDYVYKEKLMK